MSGLHLMRPEWLLLTMPALLLTYMLWRRQERRGNWRSVISPELLPYLFGENAGEKRRNLVPALLLGWLLACLAAAGPSFTKIPQPVHQKQDAMVLLYDLSYSMKSQDLSPSRADRARQKLKDLLAKRREGQTGLIAFAGDAHIVTPLTDDIPTINNLLPALHPDMMPVPGSDAADAVALGLSLLRSAGIRGGRMLLVTDGVSSEAASEIRQQLRGSGVGLTVMGVGTRNGAPIPLQRGGFLKDDDGAIVMPRLEEGDLRELALSVGGTYTPMRIDDGDLRQLLAEPLLAGADQTLALDRTADTWEDQGYQLVLLLLPLVLVLFRRGWVLGIVPLLLLQPPESHAQGWSELWATPDQQGQRAFQRGDAAAAAELFEHPGWAGTAAYENGDFETAAERFGAVPSADGWFNRGNALAHAGQLEDAIKAYEESLQLAPDREDALANKALIEELLQQQEQQEQQQQQEGDQQEQSENGEQQEQQGEQQSDSSSSDDSQGNKQRGEQDSASNTQEDAQAEQDDSGAPREEQQAEQEQQENGEEQAPAEPGEGEESESSLARAELSPEEQERNQAMEQWLRRVPDDPSGLLREKFRYESRLRRDEGRERQHDQVW